jgi:hypothetical protein
MAPVPSTERPITDTGDITGTDRIGATDITAVTMVAGITAEALMVDTTIEGVIMAAVPTITTIGTIDCAPIGERLGISRKSRVLLTCFANQSEGAQGRARMEGIRLPNFVSNAAASR